MVATVKKAAGFMLVAIAALVFAGALVLCPIKAFANGDTIAPIVESISVQNAEVMQGEEIAIDLGIVEDGVGATHVYVSFRSVESNDKGENHVFALQRSYENDRVYTGNLTLSESNIDGAVVGDYYVFEVYVVDYLNNTRSYSRTSPYEDLKDSDGNVIDAGGAALTIVEGSDSVAPLLSNIGVSYISEEEGTIKFSFDAVEEGSGIVKLEVELDSKTNVTDNASVRHLYRLVDENTNSGDGLTTGSYTLTEFWFEDGYASSFYRPGYDGEYFFRQISVYDAQGNSTVYHFDNEGSSYSRLVSDSGGFVDVDSTIVVGEGPFDDVVPKVNSIEILTDKVTRPGVAVFRVDVAENDGVSWLQINLWNENQEQVNLIFGVVDCSTGVYDFEVPISEDTLLGTYTLYGCELEDFSGNRIAYDYWACNGGDLVGASPADCKLGVHGSDSTLDAKGSLEILSEDIPVSFETSLGNPNLIQMVEDMENSGIARINVDTNGRSVIPAALFEAIDETNKTLWFYGDGVDWVFNGLTIKKEHIKDINPFLGIEIVSGDLYGCSSFDVVRLEFADNGVLPGRAIMRLKMDYLTYMYDLSSGLYLYFEDESGLDDQMAFFSLEDDGYIEFPIYHNSTYLISAEELSEGFNPNDGSESGSSTGGSESDSSADGSSGEDDSIVQPSSKEPIAQTGDGAPGISLIAAVSVSAISLIAAFSFMRRSAKKQ